MGAPGKQHKNTAVSFRSGVIILAGMGVAVLASAGCAPLSLTPNEVDFRYGGEPFSSTSVVVDTTESWEISMPSAPQWLAVNMLEGPPGVSIVILTVEWAKVPVEGDHTPLTFYNSQSQEVLWVYATPYNRTPGRPNDSSCCDGSPPLVVEQGGLSGWGIVLPETVEPGEDIICEVQGFTPSGLCGGEPCGIIVNYLYEYTVEGSDGYYDHGQQSLELIGIDSGTSYYESVIEIPGAAEGVTDCVTVLVETGGGIRLCDSAYFGRVQLK